MATSQNGYPANDVNRTANRLIPGTSRSIRVAKGQPGFLLIHFAAWFDKNIESVDGGIYDDWGYAERPVRGSTTTLSNHASGTAIDLNAPRHPLGVRNTFTAAQAAKIRTQLRRYDGAIRWGGDYSNRPDEMHFEINTSRGHVNAVANRIRREDKTGNTIQEEDDMPDLKDIAKAILNADVPVPGTKRTIALKYALGQAWHRAGDARDAAREANKSVSDLAALVADTTLTPAARKKLVDDIARRTAVEVDRLDAAAVAEQLELTVKENQS